ncbi:MAG TPA: hypothetical protein VFU63_14235 [Ktedonobacterales bacterium]|nr:hypothetical protein [Ktedonobacterales bacterium]
MTAKIASWVVRIGGLALLVLGVLFWTGNALTFVQEHMTLGLLVVLALWVLAVTAMRQGVGVGLVASALLLGIVVIVFGMTQTTLLIGPAHVVIEVIHLLLGLALISLGEIITGQLRRLSQGARATAAA